MVEDKDALYFFAQSLPSSADYDYVVVVVDLFLFSERVEKVRNLSGPSN